MKSPPPPGMRSVLPRNCPPSTRLLPSQPQSWTTKAALMFFITLSQTRHGVSAGSAAADVYGMKMNLVLSDTSSWMYGMRTTLVAKPYSAPRTSFMRLTKFVPFISTSSIDSVFMTSTWNAGLPTISPLGASKTIVSSAPSKRTDAPFTKVTPERSAPFGTKSNPPDTIAPLSKLADETLSPESGSLSVALLESASVPTAIGSPSAVSFSLRHPSLTSIVPE